MARRHAPFRIQLASAALSAAVALFAAAGMGFAAEQPSEDQIRDALRPKKITRSMGANPEEAARNAENERFLQTLRTKRTRSLSMGERQKVAAIAADKPSIDIEIRFDYNSAKIGPQAVPALTQLGRALTSPDLSGGVFLLAGHTDAKGGEAYNQDLSDRRAEAVKNYLVQKFGVASDNLVAVGYGETRLKDQSNPLAEENRRVQVSNMK